MSTRVLHTTKNTIYFSTFIAAVGKGKKAKKEVGSCGGGSGGCFCVIIATEENGVPSIIKEATFLGKGGLQMYYNHQVDEMLFR